MYFQENMYIKSLTVKTIDGDFLSLPDKERLYHLQFRRFAGCPVCSLHLQSFVRRIKEIQSAGITEIIVFHTSAENVLPYVTGYPFLIIPDPQKKLYREFGVESSRLALLYPKAILKIITAVVIDLYQVIFKKKKMPPLKPEGGSLGLPADFLIDGDGKILAVKYGKHASDQWSVDELLEIKLNKTV